LEILTNPQKKILNLVSNLPDKEAFYLTGGAALSAFYFVLSTGKAMTLISLQQK